MWFAVITDSVVSLEILFVMNIVYTCKINHKDEDTGTALLHLPQHSDWAG